MNSKDTIALLIVGALIVISAPTGSRNLSNQILSLSGQSEFNGDRSRRLPVSVDTASKPDDAIRARISDTAGGADVSNTATVLTAEIADADRAKAALEQHRNNRLRDQDRSGKRKIDRN